MLKKNKRNKGFINSIVAGSLVILLIVFITMLHNSYLSSERGIRDAQPIIYSKFFFDDVFNEVNEIVGPDIRINQSNNTIILAISDSLPKLNFTGQLEHYGNFIENEMAGDLHTNISVNFSMIEDGTLEVFLLDHYLYNNSYAGNNAVFFGTEDPNGKTDVTSYEVNLTLYGYRKSLQDFSWSPDGDVSVVVHSTDYNGTWQSSGLLNSSETNSLTITLVSNITRSVDLIIGKIGQREGALLLSDTNSSPDFSLSVTIPIYNNSLSSNYYYNAELNYSLMNTTKNGLIGN